MSDYPANAKQAAPPVQLEVHIAEWWAMGEIQRLRTELAEARRDAEHWREARRSAIEAGDALMTELAEARRDVEQAAGELVVAMPEPGTDMARVMHANAMMRRERDALRAELAEARRDAEAARADYRCALQYIERLRNERDAAVAHAGDAARGET